MKKKRLTKGQKKLIEDIEVIRNRALISLKDRILFLIKRSEELMSKVERSGADSNYSVSSDIYRISEEIYRLELRLAELGLIKYNIQYEDNED